MSLPNSSHKLTDPPFLKKKKPLHRFRLSYLRVISKGTGSYSIGVDSRTPQSPSIPPSRPPNLPVYPQ
uniref:Uncharacterized protein n=1 Tax=Meloidogyne enterolobii TaxID=390850 RepID=A0A6V7YDL8_MELEN|nr:unnamed protein product [Meloidogyne enterolobii]